MPECADLEARKDIAQLWTAHRELGSVLWGDDGRRDNGIRSKVRAQEEKLGELEIAQRSLHEQLRHYFDREREETCLGLRALAEHEQIHEEEGKEDTEVKVAEVTAGGAVQAARAAARGQVAREWVVIGGIGLLFFKDVVLELIKTAPK
jgi:hypothetical protein